MRKGFVIHHNGPPANCIGQPHSRCERFWQAVCRYHGQKFGAKWAATSLYSHGMCPHGTRFTGVGWFARQAANGSDQVGADDGRDSEWFTVLAFVGTDEPPTDAIVDALRDLIDEGRRRGLCGDAVLPHNRFKQKACPGPELTAIAHQWDGQPLEEDEMSQKDVDEIKATLAVIRSEQARQHGRVVELLGELLTAVVTVRDATRATVYGARDSMVAAFRRITGTPTVDDADEALDGDAQHAADRRTGEALQRTIGGSS